MEQTPRLLPPDWTDTIKAFHHDELVGEAFFLELFRTERQPEARLKLAHLAQIETENKTWLRGPLLAGGLSIVEPLDVLKRGRALAQGFGSAWQDKMVRLRDSLAAVYVPRFKSYLDQAEVRGNRLEIAACRLMLEHDVAFLEFAERDLAGGLTADVLEPLRARLRFPLDEMPWPSTSQLG